jgi:hypothetical protein
MCWPHVNPVPSGAVGKDCQRRLLSRPKVRQSCSATDYYYKKDEVVGWRRHITCSFVICIRYHVLVRLWIQGRLIDRTCSEHAGNKKCIKLFNIKRWGKRPFCSPRSCFYDRLYLGGGGNELHSKQLIIYPQIICSWLYHTYTYKAHSLSWWYLRHSFICLYMLMYCAVIGDFGVI